MLLIVFVQITIHFLLSYSNSQLTELTGKVYRDSIARGLLKKTPKELEAIAPGDFISKVASDVDLVKGFLSELFLASILNLITIIWIAYALLMKNQSLTLLILFAIIASIVVGKQFGVKLEKKIYSSRIQFSNLLNTFSQITQDLIPIKIYKVENKMYELFEKSNEKFLNIKLSIVRLASLISTSNILLLTIPSLLILSFGGRNVFNGTLSVGDIVATIMLCSFLLAPIQSFIVALTISMPSTSSVFKRIQPFLGDNSNVGKYSKGINSFDNIVLKEVNFQYENADFALEIKRLNLRKGEITGIIGDNGVGKSTLGKILQGIYPITYGRIFSVMDSGVEFILSPELLFDTSVLVTKRDFFKLGTTQENLTIFGENNDSEKLERLKFKLFGSHALDFSKVEKQDSLSKLSDGEKQLIILCRALGTNSVMVVLDEPESSLDINKLGNLIGVLREEAADRIIVLITHSKDLINICDRVFEIKKISNSKSLMAEIESL